MYKYLIITIALMFTVAGGYYIDQAGGGIMGNILTGNITTQDTLIPVNIDDIPGEYVCKTVSACNNKYTLILKNDRTAELIKSSKVTHENSSTTETGAWEETPSDAPTDEVTNNTEKGQWDLGVKNMLIVTLTEKGENTYTVPQKIVIKSIGTKTLSKISYTKNNYKDMHNPIFFKQE